MRATGILLGLVAFALPAQAQFTGRIDGGLGGPGAQSNGWMTASWFQSLAQPVQFELTGTAQVQHGSGIADAGAGWGGARVHLSARQQGLWLGLQAGRDYLGATRRWEAAAWKELGAFSIQVQGWQTATSMAVRADTGTSLPDTLNPSVGDERRVRTTTDLGVWVRWNGRRTELAVASGLRFGLNEPGLRPLSPGGDLGGAPRQTGSRSMLSSTWWMLEGTWWAMDRIGLVGSVGRRPTDPSVASAGESFLRVGFRAALQRRRVEPKVLVPSRFAAAFRAERREDELVEFTLVEPKAERVELMGDFNDWSPVEMIREAGVWRVRLPASAGLHRVNVRYDGGSWRAPPGSRVVKDEFGAESGEMVIR